MFNYFFTFTPEFFLLTAILITFYLPNTLNKSLNVLILSITLALFLLSQDISIVKVVITLSALVLAFMSLESEEDEGLTVLKLLSLVGMFILVDCQSFLHLYLGIELSSLPLYLLAGYNRNNQYSLEAGMKYFILGALSSGLFLMGVGFLVYSTGHLDYSTPLFSSDTFPAYLILISLFFKLAVAPFHHWAPDVYEGSSTIVTAFFVIVPKIAIVAAIHNLVVGPFVCINIIPLFVTCSVISIIIGALGGLNQVNFKRLIAYSSIGQIGFIIMGLSLEGGYSISLFYLITYIITNLVLFSILLKMKLWFNLNSYVGLVKDHPYIALIISVCLFSLAGIPPFVGFMAKYMILKEALINGYYIWSVIAVLASIVSAFFYIRIIVLMYFGNLQQVNDISVLRGVTNKGTVIKSFIIGLGLFFITTFILFPNIIMDFLVIKHI